ncbi:MAG: hypothetical protein IJB48_00095 [Clostridia bacterium]|nr:hypothetical protein [Clostridia bacterium]MBQ3553690.1 hypothetical protein [Clostridia bacterium]
MPEKRKHIPSPSDNMEELGLKSCASATECTGLIRTPAETIDGAEAYRDIFDYGPQDPEDRKMTAIKDKI